MTPFTGQCDMLNIYVIAFCCIFTWQQFVIVSESSKNETEFTDGKDNADNFHHPSEHDTQYHGGAGNVRVDSFVHDMMEMESSKDPAKDIPIILWWADRLCHAKGLQEIKCLSGAKCYTTCQRKFLRDRRTRGIYFYGTDIEVTNLPLPRHGRHEWMLFHEESPMNDYMLVHGQMIKLFNHTATFKRESDFPLTTQHIPSLSYLTERSVVSLSIKNDLRSKGYAAIIYVQSHCEVASDRDRYVKELMKYIQIDSYGACLNNKKIPPELKDPVESMHSDEFLKLLSNYKFHLSFENAICNDYMTEKLFRSLHVGSVPIYKGSPRTKDWMPTDKSIIMVDEFESPKTLAEYVDYLDKNDTAYQEFLSYKSSITNENLIQALHERSWGINDPVKPDYMQDFECHVCEKLERRHHLELMRAKDNNITLPPPNIAKSDHMHCPQPYTSYGDITDLPSSDRWLQQHWVDDYWNGLDKAMAIRKMLEKNESNSGKFYKYLKEVSNH